MKKICFITIIYIVPFSMAMMALVVNTPATHLIAVSGIAICHIVIGVPWFFVDKTKFTPVSIGIFKALRY